MFACFEAYTYGICTYHSSHLDLKLLWRANFTRRWSTRVYMAQFLVPSLRSLMKSGVQPLRPHGPFSTITNFCLMKMSIDAFRPGEGQWVPLPSSSLPESTPRGRVRWREKLRSTVLKPYTRHTTSQSTTGHEPSAVAFNAFQSNLSTAAASQAACEWGKDESLDRGGLNLWWNKSCMFIILYFSNFFIPSGILFYITVVWYDFLPSVWCVFKDQWT